MIHVRVFNIDSLTIEDLDTLLDCMPTVLNRHRFTVAIQHGSVQYRSNVVESNDDTILFVVTLESIRYLQYWNENTIESTSNTVLELASSPGPSQLFNVAR